MKNQDIQNNLAQLLKEANTLIEGLEAKKQKRLIYGKFTIADKWMTKAKELIVATGDYDALKKYNEIGLLEFDPESDDEACFEYTRKIVSARKAFLLEYFKH